MKRLWQIGNIVSVLFALIANFLVGSQLLGLPAINEVSDKYATYLTPASYAFSIWSLIYLLLVVFAVYQARDIIRPQSDNDLPHKIGPFFIIANLCNGLWTYIFVNEWVAASVATLITLTVSLYILLWRLRIAKSDESAVVISCMWWPLLIYTGWVTIASITNIASWLDSLGILLTPIIASLVVIGVTVGLIALLFTRNVRELVIASAWGIIAIGAAQLSGETLVAITAFSAGGVVIVAAMVHGYMNRDTNILTKLRK